MLSASAHAQAAESYQGMQAVTREVFLLPMLGSKLEAFREEVRIGRGFQLFRCTHINFKSQSIPKAFPAVYHTMELQL